jgi:hypothetical protein
MLHLLIIKLTPLPPPASCHCDTNASVPGKAAVSSPDGTKVAAVTEEGVDVYDRASGRKMSVCCVCSRQTACLCSARAEPAWC